MKLALAASLRVTTDSPDPSDHVRLTAMPSPNAFLVIVSADAEWRAVAGLFPSSTMKRTPFGECFHYDSGSWQARGRGNSWGCERRAFFAARVWDGGDFLSTRDIKASVGYLQRSVSLCLCGPS